MKKALYGNFDKPLLAVTLIIAAIGLSSIYSATWTESASLMANLALKQALWLAIGLSILFAVMKTDYRIYVDLAYILFGINIILLAAVLLYGHTRYGAQRWVAIGGFGFQPSEFMKITTVLALSAYLGKRAKYSYKAPELLAPFALIAPPLLLIYMQPDLGTALMLVPILFALLYVRGAKTKHLLFIMALGILSLPFLWHMLKDYQRERLTVFINPNADPLGAGYTMIQSRIAIGSGFIMGKGWLSGTQNQLNFLPERHTDFIFSVVGEEGGFIGCAVLIALYCILVYRGLKAAYLTADAYGRLMAAGITTMLACQIIVNIGMASGFMPVVGLPLPLLSYGGSSFIATMFSIGLLLSIGIHRPRF